MTANKQQKHEVLQCQSILLISGAHQCLDPSTDFLSELRQFIPVTHFTFSLVLYNWLFICGRFTRMTEELNIASRQWWSDFILTSSSRKTGIFLFFLLVIQFLSSFKRCTDCLYSFSGNFFLWNRCLKVDRTDSWSSDSLEADWDCAEGSWALFTAAALGRPVTANLACNGNSDSTVV